MQISLFALSVGKLKCSYMDYETTLIRISFDVQNLVDLSQELIGPLFC